MTAKKRSRSLPAEEIATSGKTAAQKLDAKAALGFPIVGIGASAEGLQHSKRFFLQCLPTLVATWLLFWCSIWRRTTRAYSPS
jgi:hypothetical protein